MDAPGNGQLGAPQHLGRLLVIKPLQMHQQQRLLQMLGQGMDEPQQLLLLKRTERRLDQSISETFQPPLL